MIDIPGNIRVVRANKNAIMALRWVLKATCPEPLRYKALHVTSSEFAARNGHQIHIARPQIDNPFPEGRWIVRSVKDGLVMLEESEFEAINYQAVVETSRRSTIASPGAGAVVLSARLDPLYFALALSAPCSNMQMIVGNGPVTFYGNINDEIDLQAVVFLSVKSDNVAAELMPARQVQP